MLATWWKSSLLPEKLHLFENISAPAMLLKYTVVKLIAVMIIIEFGTSGIMPLLDSQSTQMFAQ